MAGPVDCVTTRPDGRGIDDRLGRGGFHAAGSGERLRGDHVRPEKDNAPLTGEGARRHDPSAERLHLHPRPRRQAVRRVRPCEARGTDQDPDSEESRQRAREIAAVQRRANHDVRGRLRCGAGKRGNPSGDDRCRRPFQRLRGPHRDHDREERRHVGRCRVGLGGHHDAAHVELRCVAEEARGGRGLA
jgi:hypothetical protein